MSPREDVERRAIALARGGDFGAAALTLNLQLSELAPGDESTWTRLGRCHTEAGNFAAAEEALRTALRINDQSTVARSLLSDVRRARQFVPSAGHIDRGSGFGLDYFNLLGQSSRAPAGGALAGKIDTLLMAVNEMPAARTIVSARAAAGRPGSRLYHRNSHQWTSGHVSVFHDGGRWEPQFNIGFFSAHQWPANAVRAGIGFNLTMTGVDRDQAAGQERALAYFAAFQRAISARWRRSLVEWMAGNAGYVQFGYEGPLVDWPAERAVDWITSVGNPVLEEWIFLGRWFHPHVARDRDVVADMRRLSQAIDATFRDLLPLWTDVWNSAD